MRRKFEEFKWAIEHEQEHRYDILPTLLKLQARFNSMKAEKSGLYSFDPLPDDVRTHKEMLLLCLEYIPTRMKLRMSQNADQPNSSFTDEELDQLHIIINQKVDELTITANRYAAAASRLFPQEPRIKDQATQTVAHESRASQCCTIC